MNYWIFVVTNSDELVAQEIYQIRMKDCFWGLEERTPNRKNLAKGDKVVFYIGLPDKSLAGTATLASGNAVPHLRFGQV